MIRGIDVSRWQGIIQWPIVARNTDFAIVKIGGSDQGFYPDGQAVRNALEARAAGIPVHFYVYLGGASATKDEISHIKNLINNIGGLRAGEKLWLDWEEENTVEVQYLYEIAKGLIDAGINAPGIYMNLAYVRRNNWSIVAGLGCPLWIAAWGNNDDKPDTAPPSDEWSKWTIWQYSSTGTVPGISGRVDMNLFNGSVADFKNLAGNRPVTMPAPVNTSRVVIPNGGSEYTVQSGDNLSVIAARYGKNWQELWNLNRDRVSNPNRIYPGLKLRVWGTTPGKSAPAKSADNTRWHTVQSGENLSVIAAKYGLPSYVILWEANKDIIPDPNLIRPDQKLRIP